MPDLFDLGSMLFHESPHAGVARQLAMPVIKIGVVSDGGLLDDYTRADARPAGLEDCIATLKAGKAAERWPLGYEAATRPHMGSDPARIVNAFARASGSQ